MNQLDPVTFPLHGLRLIEASAGTGKTYTIAALYVRLVIGHDRPAPLMPADILVLTFTRAATRELRDRIRTRLSEAARSFISGKSEHEFIDKLLEQHPGPEQRARIARRLQVAAESMDEAAIHTIHAWCQSILKRHAFDSGSLFDQEVDSGDPELWRTALLDYWRRFIVPRQNDDGAWLKVFASFPDFAKRIGELLQPEVEFRCNGRQVEAVGSPDEPIEAMKAWKRQQEEILAPVHQQWQEQREELIEFILKARSSVLHGNKYQEPTVHGWFKRLDDGRLSPDMQSRPLVKLSTSGLVEGTKNNKTPPEHPFFDTVERARQALEEMPPEPSWQPQLWKHAAEWVGKRYRQEKRKRNRLDFDDLLTDLDAALRGPGGERLAQTILESHPVAMLDEFQDTDPVQYRIFETVYGPAAGRPENGLFMIGDPKQAIYSFRQADIHTYLRARRDAVEASGEPFTLPRNYRSTLDFVDAVNALFDTAENQPQGAFAMREDAESDNPVPFERVDAKGRGEVFVQADTADRRASGPHLLPVLDGLSRQGDQHLPASPIVFWHLPETDEKPTFNRSDYESTMGRWTAAAIAELLEQGADGRAGFLEDDKLTAVSPSDIAVLVNDRHQAAAVKRELERRDVAAVYLSEGNSIFDQSEAKDALLILRAVAEPDDDRLLRNALGTRTAGLDARELERLNEDELRLEAEGDRFRNLHSLWRRRGVLVMLRRLVDEYDVAARLLADRRDGERRLTNLMHLAELLQVEGQGHEGPQALIRWLAGQISTKERGQDDEQILRLESDAELVRIVTVFKSKGLEYPLVFVPFAASNRRQPQSTDWRQYHDPATRRRVIEFEKSDEANRIADRERLQEDLRLLYVAVTRARHACWIGTAPWVSDKRSKKPDTDTALFHLLGGVLKEEETVAGVGMSELLQRLVKRMNADKRLAHFVELHGEAPDKRYKARSDEELADVPEYPRRDREPWWVASYSALRYGGSETEAAGDPAASAVAANMAEMSEDDEAGSSELELPDPLSRTPDPESIHAFPRGATPGNFLHLLLEWAGGKDFSRLDGAPEMLRQEVEARCRRRGWDDWAGTVQAWLLAQLKTPMPIGDTRVRLADLSLARHQYKPELEFWLQASRVPAGRIDDLAQQFILPGRERPALAPNQLNGMLHGFIDLVFEWQGRWYVADYKSNWLGPDARYYTREQMEATILSRRYDLQYALYALALHRQLKARMGDSYDPSREFGGAAYMFLRGVEQPDTAGVFFDPLSPELLIELDELFRQGSASHAA
ncbi:MAG: exodeoxyribonuclease V subunit beta [Xanthomonadales bacterium]|nr:exodeoxyribonuclease V subunit beta [Xanthomonadales bacterium]